MNKFEHILQELAIRHDTTPEQVRRDMQEAMDAGMRSPDPSVQAMWRRIPKKGDTLTLEELVTFLASQL